MILINAFWKRWFTKRKLIWIKWYNLKFFSFVSKTYNFFLYCFSRVLWYINLISFKFYVFFMLTIRVWCNIYLKLFDLFTYVFFIWIELHILYTLNFCFNLIVFTFSTKVIFLDDFVHQIVEVTSLIELIVLLFMVLNLFIYLLTLGKNLQSS
jgi:hypothetical protein